MAKAPVVYLVGLLLVLAPPLFAEEAEEDTLKVGEWGVTSDLNITLTQNAYSDNWAGSELGAISWAMNSNSLAESQLTERVHSRNTLVLAFGQTHSQRVDEEDGESDLHGSTLHWAAGSPTRGLHSTRIGVRAGGGGRTRACRSRCGIGPRTTRDP